MLAAWQGPSGFEGRASVRTWLYRVTTARCLNVETGTGNSYTLARGCPMLGAGGAVEICELTSHDERFDQWLDAKGGRCD